MFLVLAFRRIQSSAYKNLLSDLEISGYGFRATYMEIGGIIDVILRADRFARGMAVSFSVRFNSSERLHRGFPVFLLVRSYNGAISQSLSLS